MLPLLLLRLDIGLAASGGGLQAMSPMTGGQPTSVTIQNGPSVDHAVLIAPKAGPKNRPSVIAAAMRDTLARRLLVVSSSHNHACAVGMRAAQLSP